MFRLFFILFFCTVFGMVSAQNVVVADTLFQSGNYAKAFEAYKNLLKNKPKPKDAPLYNYRFAFSAYKLNDTAKAIEYFKKAAVKFPESNYHLGNIYFDSYHFDKAAKAFGSYLSNQQGDNVFPDAQKKLQQSEIGDRLMHRIDDIEIVDSMVVDKNDIFKKFHLSPELGKLTQKTVLSENNTIDKISYTTQRGDRKYLSDTKNGNSDLFTANKLLNNWAERVPLNDLNTVNNENYPFLMLDGVTLYFARDGEGSLGGYDIFITRFDPENNTFLKPENVGMPYNSPFNDYLMMVDETHKVGWFLSDRYQPEGKVTIYEFIPNFEKKIVKTENPDSLINRAKITHFERKSKLSYFTNQVKSTNLETTPKGYTIFINDEVSYTNTNDFKSNTARNLYFQWQKLSSEKEKILSSLDELRKSYAEANNEDMKKSLSNKILAFENQLLDINPRLKQFEKSMRNEEIKKIKSEK